MSDRLPLQSVLNFLVNLQANNDRAWFEQHRADYQQAKEQFEALINLVIDELRATEDLGAIRAKDCVMRIYRDVRFSKDKSPYRTHFGASIAAGGRKSSRMPYYLHLAPQNESFLAGGLYMPTSDQLAQFRAMIDHNAKPFKAILNTKAFKQAFGTLCGEQLKTAPQGYARDHPEIELLKFKQIIVVHSLTDEAVLANDFPVHVVQTFTTLKPFLDYLNTIVLP